VTDPMRVSPPKSHREGWDEAAKEMTAAEEDEYLWCELPVANESDGEEW
jgi:hypothetical protein